MYIPHQQVLAEYSLSSQNLQDCADRTSVNSNIASYTGAPNLPPGYDYPPPTGLDFIPFLVKLTWGIWFLIVACMICRGIYEKFHQTDDATTSDSASSIAESTWRIEDSSYSTMTTTSPTADDIVAHKHQKRLKKLEQLAPTQSLRHWRAEKQLQHIENFATASPRLSCAICIDPLEETDQIRELSCGHVYHAGCLNLWVERGHHDCPLCKYDILKLRQQQQREEEEQRQQELEAAREGDDVVITIPEDAVVDVDAVANVETEAIDAQQQGQVIEVGQPSSQEAT